MRRLAPFLAVLLLVACTSSTSPSQTPTASTATSLAWSDCSAPFQCATLQVPLDYANPTQGSISLALIRLPASSPSTRIGSLVLNPGGPGASGIQFLRSASLLLSSLHAHFDLVSFDPRGIGASTPVHCLDASTLDKYNALDPVLDDNAEKLLVIQADQAFAAGCQKESAKLLPYLSTASTARDLDQIRQALHDQKLTYLGFSYGTFLGLTYASMFPTHVRALVLDGVFNPALDANTLLHDQLAGFEDNLQAFFANCRVQATTCTLAKQGNPSDVLNNLMDSLDSHPLPVGSRFLTRGLAYLGVLAPLYDPSSWPQLDSAITAAAKGDGSQLLALSDFYLDRQPDGTYSNEEEAGLAINCLDRPVPSADLTSTPADTSAYDALAVSYDQASPFFGPGFQYANLSCVNWPAPVVMQPAPASVTGAPPLLLVGATHDPATPYAWAQAVASTLPTSVLLTRDGYGHTSYGSSSCIEQAVDAYLLNLTLPPPDTTCPSGA